MKYEFLFLGQAVSIAPTNSPLYIGESGAPQLTCTGPDQIFLLWYHNDAIISSSDSKYIIYAQVC